MSPAPPLPPAQYAAAGLAGQNGPGPVHNNTAPPGVQTSPNYPHRLILPMPKRRVLPASATSSPEAGKAGLVGGPSTPSRTPLFHLPYTYPPVDGNYPPPPASSPSPNAYTSTASIRTRDGLPVPLSAVQSQSPAQQQLTPGRQEVIFDSSDSEGDLDAVDNCRHCSRGCCDWSEANASNKKKRKIPGFAAQGGSNTGGSGASVSYQGVGGVGRTASGSRRRTSTRGTSVPLSPANPAVTPSKDRHAAVGVDGENGIVPEGDFSFVCESPVAKNLPTPVPHNYIPPPIPEAPGPSHQMAPTSMSAHTAPQVPPPPKPNPPKKTPSSSRLPPPRTRKPRPQNTEPKEIWVCQFCEYEAIFGEWPEYLSRLYDRKVREERKARAERRRLLEKAKMAGKGKKGFGKKKTTTPTTNNNAQGTDANGAPIEGSVDSGHAEDGNGHHIDGPLSEGTGTQSEHGSYEGEGHDKILPPALTLHSGHQATVGAGARTVVDLDDGDEIPVPETFEHGGVDEDSFDSVD
ncbi:hypothetical protein YB2330_006584 [Saitoella coloradoensis]